MIVVIMKTLSTTTTATPDHIDMHIINATTVVLSKLNIWFNWSQKQCRNIPSGRDL